MVVQALHLKLQLLIQTLFLQFQHPPLHGKSIERKRGIRTRMPHTLSTILQSLGARTEASTCIQTQSSPKFKSAKVILMVPRTCLDCSVLIRKGNRCTSCQRVWERNRSKHRQAYLDPVYRSQPKTGICHICGLPGADTRDHVIPLNAGGSNDPSNIKPAHRACNSSKGVKLSGSNSIRTN